MADATLAIGQEQSFAIWLGLGTLCRGAGLAMAGRHLEGAELIRLGLGGSEATGAGLSATHCLCRLADALLAVGQLEEAEQAIGTGLTIAEASGERFAEAELHRLRGEIALARHAAESEAMACLQQAIAVSERQGARSWELKARTSLCRVLSRQGRRDEAREALSGIVAWFTEGLGTRDLVEARRSSRASAELRG